MVTGVVSATCSLLRRRFGREMHPSERGASNIMCRVEVMTTREYSPQQSSKPESHSPLAPSCIKIPGVSGQLGSCLDRSKWQKWRLGTQRVSHETPRFLFQNRRGFLSRLRGAPDAF